MESFGIMSLIKRRYDGVIDVNQEIFHNKPVKRQLRYCCQPTLYPPKDYGINGFLPEGALQLFRFLLVNFLCQHFISAFFFPVFLLKNIQRSLKGFKEMDRKKRLKTNQNVQSKKITVMNMSVRLARDAEVRPPPSNEK